MKAKPFSRGALLALLILYTAVTALHSIPHDHSGKVGTPERCLICQWGQTSKANLSNSLSVAVFSFVTLRALFLYKNPSKEIVLTGFTTRAPPILV